MPADGGIREAAVHLIERKMALRLFGLVEDHDTLLSGGVVLSLGYGWSERYQTVARSRIPGTGTFPDIRGPAAAPIAEENGPENAARIIAMVSSRYVT